jgi:trimeric autotransporter adhesin
MHRLLIPLTLAATAILAQPAIKTGGIANVSGYQATLAPGVVFVIFGSAMGPASIVTASAPNYPTSLGGTSVTFTPTSGAPVAAKMVYSVAGQVAGLLPSSATPGTYAVTVTYNSQTSPPQNVTVAARSFGIATSNSAGNGTVQATIGNVNGGLSLTRFSPGSVAFGGYTWTLTPAHPGDTLVLWGTGGGADPANDAGGTSGDQTAAGNFVVNVGGTAITPLYAGAASGYPGLWQINFTLPATIAPNCFAATQVSAGGQLSNAVTIPIAAVGQTSCAAAGFSPSTLATLDAGGNVTFSGLTVGKVAYYTNGVPTNIDGFGGPISRFSAAEWLTMYSGAQIGPCVVLDQTYPVGGKEPSGADAFLNAGASISMNGPGIPTPGTVTPVINPVGPVYINKPTGAALVAGGTYTISGQGGSQVGPFRATATIPASFSITNLSSLTSISRSQPVTINWSGTGFDQVLILFETSATTATTYHGVSMQCAVPAAPGSYTVPAAALAHLLPGSGQLVVTTATAVPGIVSPESSSGLNATIPLVAGGQIDFGGFAAFLGVLQLATFQ